METWFQGPSPQSQAYSIFMTVVGTAYLLPLMLVRISVCLTDKYAEPGSNRMQTRIWTGEYALLVTGEPTALFQSLGT